MLARPETEFVTCASWVIDGGMLLMGPQGGSALSDDGWRHAAD
ncbi:hypothetical protein GCM10020369_13240 [Cryptosporangium minutisporangium]|uniref:Uncharacterized protein n=1 Tax=Cryptosporangium minutisporangium TaxID=113569 RepID=A0ABP6SS79_9ACTN